MTIGERIRLRRIELGLTQQELAQKIGYSDKTAINKIETNLRGLPQSKIKQMAFALETTPDYLLDWDDISASDLQHSLSSGEEQLIKYYGMLNEAGQEKALERVQELTEIDRYKKGSSASGEAAAG